MLPRVSNAPPKFSQTPIPPSMSCMFGTDVFEGVLPTMRGKSIQGKKVEIKYLAHVTDLDPEECHFLFSSGSKSVAWAYL